MNPPYAQREFFAAAAVGVMPPALNLESLFTNSV